MANQISAYPVMIYRIVDKVTTLVGMASLEHLDAVQLAVFKRNQELKKDNIKDKRFAYSIEYPIQVFSSPEEIILS